MYGYGGIWEDRVEDGGVKDGRQVEGVEMVYLIATSNHHRLLEILRKLDLSYYFICLL